MNHDELANLYASDLAELAHTYGDAAIISVGPGKALGTAFAAGVAVLRDTTLADEPALAGWKAELELSDGTLQHCCHGPTAVAAAAALHHHLGTH